MKNWCWKLLSLLIKISGLPRNHGEMLGLASLPHKSYTAKSFILAGDLAQPVSFLVTKLTIMMPIWWKSCKLLQSDTKKCQILLPLETPPQTFSLPNITEADEGSLWQHTSQVLIDLAGYQPPPGAARSHLRRDERRWEETNHICSLVSAGECVPVEVSSVDVYLAPHAKQVPGHGSVSTHLQAGEIAIDITVNS